MWSAAGSGDKGGDDICGVAVEGLAVPVVAHGGSRVRVAGGFLNIPKGQTCGRGPDRHRDAAVASLAAGHET